MQDQGTSLELLLMVVVVVILIMVFLSSSKNIKKPRKKATDWKPKKNFQNTLKRKPQNEATSKKQIKTFQKVKVEHIIDGDTIIVSKSWHKIKLRLDSI